MELEIFNEEYNYLKERLNDTNKDIKYLEKKLIELKQNKIIFQGDLIIAQRKNDHNGIAKAEEKLRKTNDRIKNIIEQAEKSKKRTEALKQRIDYKIEEVKRDPEIKEQIDTALTKRYERGLKKATSEREEEIKNKKKVTDLKTLISNHPTLQNNIKGILTASEIIKRLNNELKSYEDSVVNGNVTYKDPVKATELQTKIQQFTEKRKKNFALVEEFAKKRGINIEDIDNALNIIIGNGLVLSEKDPNNISVDVMASFEKSEKIANKNIKRYNKQIARYQVALGINEQTQENIQPEQEIATEKPKWYQFIKRFKMWNYQRQQNRLPEANSNTASRTDNQEVTNQENTDKTSQFTDSLKWEVVRDVMNSQQKEDMKEANKIIKENPDLYNINDYGDQEHNNLETENQEQDNRETR